jgi:hypothetical protein
MKQARRFAWILILIVDVGYVAWGAMAAAMPDGLIGPGGKAILPAGWAWWALLVGNTIALGSAMTYDWIVNAIGPFELTEYLGLALIFGAAAVTAPFRVARYSGTAVSRTG